jgi:hypothetical protein
MNTFRKIANLTLIMFCIGTVALAQEKTDNGFNPNSVRPVHESNIMYKVRVWRRMDLKEKQNQPFFSKNNEITKYLMEGVMSGVLTAYKYDSLTTKLTKEEFLANLKMDNTEGELSEEEKKAGFDKKTAGGDDGWGEPAKPAAGGTAAATPAPAADAGYTYNPGQLTVLDIMEDAIFDKQRSRLYFDIQSITIIIPANQTTKGFDVPVASFKYKELDRYFRSNPKCIWYNSQNQAQHKNMADAFDLRLFFARIRKESNPLDQDLNDIYNGEKQGLIKSQQMEHKLMEFEHNLWEY